MTDNYRGGHTLVISCDFIYALLSEHLLFVSIRYQGTSRSTAPLVSFGLNLQTPFKKGSRVASYLVRDGGEKVGRGEGGEGEYDGEEDYHGGADPWVAVRFSTLRTFLWLKFIHLTESFSVVWPPSCSPLQR